LRSVAAILDVRSGDTSEPSAVLQIDDTPDRNAGVVLAGTLFVAAVAAAAVWWFLSRG
jgi:hypothetical protein